jgi:hypothetical protein
MAFNKCLLYVLPLMWISPTIRIARVSNRRARVDRNVVLPDPLAPKIPHRPPVIHPPMSSNRALGGAGAFPNNAMGGFVDTVTFDQESTTGVTGGFNGANRPSMSWVNVSVGNTPSYVTWLGFEIDRGGAIKPCNSIRVVARWQVQVYSLWYIGRFFVHGLLEL